MAFSSALARSTGGETSQYDQISDGDYNRLATLVSRHTGIRLPPAKRTMVEGRLRKRMRSHGLPSLYAYCRFLFDEGGLETEMVHVIDVCTTNKTDFFREPEHFDFLANRAVPELLARRKGEKEPRLKLWSAACSNGAEAYTIAMVLADLVAKGQRFRFSILGTDISTDVVAQARRAVYGEDFVSPVPPEMTRRYVMRSRNRSVREVRIVPELRRHVQFGPINLMDEQYPFDRDVDVIFVRNVLIYFDKPTQVAVAQRLIGHLRPGGYLMLGHSETMVGSHLPVRQLAPAIFQLQ